MTQSLYTQTDIKRVREQLLAEQEFQDALTGLMIENSGALDHCHKSQLVRGVLSSRANLALGKLEGIKVRYLYDYPYDLPTFLRQAADYLESRNDERWYHSGWIKRVTADYNKLNEAQKDLVLHDLGYPKGSNGKERKERFKQLVLNRDLGYEKIRDAINNVKEST